MTDDTLETFKKHWLEEISKIENRAIDYRGYLTIHRSFLIEKMYVRNRLTKEETSKARIELEMLESKLRVALETARCRYSLQSRGLWARIAESVAGIAHRTSKDIIEST